MLVFSACCLCSSTPCSHGPQNYTGGNPTHSLDRYFPSIRELIIKNGTGNVDPFLGSPYDGYGSYRVLANMTVGIDGVPSAASSYRRSIALSNGIHTTKFTGDNGAAYTSTVYCSHPAQLCVYALESDQSINRITLGLENQIENSTLHNITCGSDYVRFQGITQTGPPLGMRYDAIASIMGSNSYMLMSCPKGPTPSLNIKPPVSLRSITILLAAGTDYDQKHGIARYTFFFQRSRAGPCDAKGTPSGRHQWIEATAEPHC